MKLTTILRWLGRILSGLLFLMWGAFFCSHIWEWFIHSESGLPPLFVWVAQLFHLIMIFGFALMVKWEKAGAIIMLIGTISFFLIITFDGNRFPFIALINLLPLMFFVLYWVFSRESNME